MSRMPTPAADALDVFARNLDFAHDTIPANNVCVKLSLTKRLVALRPDDSDADTEKQPCCEDVHYRPRVLFAMIIPPSRKTTNAQTTDAVVFVNST
jgi:hypothetical protein